MSVDVLILNTAVVDYRGPQFGFTDALVGPGGLAKCPAADMPSFSQADLAEWIRAGQATAGGPGNAAPLLARAGLKVAVGVNLGRGEFGGLDAQGRFFHDVMTANGIDMSATLIHPELPTGTTFIHDKGVGERGGIAYFPNANHDFDFEYFKGQVERLSPKIVYYMYSGLSDRGDANGGADLASFIAWCRARGIVTIADSHTLAADPHQLIESGAAVAEYELLTPLLPELDVFFTSSDEALMIVNTLGEARAWSWFSEDENIRHALGLIAEAGRVGTEARARLFGVTFSRGAYITHNPQSVIHMPHFHRFVSRFMAGEVIDLVGAGDSFRAGVIADLAHNIENFKAGRLDVERTVQMGNLFASLFIKAPLHDRYGNLRPYEKMLAIVQGEKEYASLGDLVGAMD